MYKKEILKNGVRLLTSPLKGTKTVTVLVLVGTGSKYETREISGISHFLEHMMFKGTKKRKDTLVISGELDSVGAEYNAFTGDEYTGYYVKSDFTHLDLALDMVSDMLINSQFHKKDIEKEKGVVIEEINMYKDNPMRKVAQNLETLIYGDQPAGWDIAGTKETVSSFSQKDVFDYFSSQYVAENTIVCVSGNFDKKEIKNKIEKYFNGIKRGEPVKKDKVVESQISPQLDVEYKKTDQTHFFIGFRSDVRIADDKAFALALLGNILGGNMSSRLFINVREKQGLAYYISSGKDLATDTGYFWIRAGVDNKRAKLAVKSVLSEVRKIKRNGVTKEELKKAKEYYKGKTLMQLESSDELAEFFAFQEMLEERILLPEEYIEKIMSVKLIEVNALAKELFQNKNLNMALIGPFDKKEEFCDILKI